MSDVIPRISAVINPLMSKHKMRAKFPVPVWDDTGSLIGVMIHQDRKMGPQECVAEASFVLAPSDMQSPWRMTAKIQLAINAIESEVQMSIRPKRKEKTA